MPAKSKIVFPIIVLLILTLKINCSTTTRPEIQEDTPIEISEEFLADRIGNNDGSVSIEELNHVKSHFSEYREGWFTGIFKLINVSDPNLTAETVLEYFHAFTELSPNESSLREQYGMGGPKTPVIIYKIVYNNRYFITECYTCSGSMVYDGEWTKINIVQ